MDFNDNFSVMILEIVSPKSLEVFKEHKYIHMLNTLKPSGIHSMNPFYITLPATFTFIMNSKVAS